MARCDPMWPYIEKVPMYGPGHVEDKEHELQEKLPPVRPSVAVSSRGRSASTEK